MKLTQKNLIESGYKRFTSAHNLAECFYQKRIVKDGATLYFINVYFYPRHEGKDFDGYMPEAQIYLDKNHRKWVDVTLGGFSAIEEVEDFFAHFFKQMECAANEPK